MSGLSYADREQIWIQAGGDPNAAPMAAAISMAENGSGDPGSIGTIAPGEYSVGLWQINVGAGNENRITQYGWSPAWLSDPVNNAKAAIQISGNGRNWGDWSTYLDGSYRTYLSGEPPSSFQPGNGGTNSIPKLDSGCQTVAVSMFGTKYCFDPLFGAGAILVGISLMLGGVAVLVAFALRATPAGRQAAQAVSLAGVPGKAVGAVVASQQAREQRRATAAASRESARRDAVDRQHREAMQRSQLRVTRARARVAESRARSQSPSRPTVVKNEVA